VSLNHRWGLLYCQLLLCCSWYMKWDSTNNCLLSRWLHWVQVTSTRAVWKEAIVEAVLSRINRAQGLTRFGDVIMEALASTTLLSRGTTWSPITGCHLLLHICSGHPLEESGVVKYLLTTTTGKAITITTTVTTRLQWRFSWQAVACKMHHTMNETCSF
jgi:hypothetical protein